MEKFITNGYLKINNPQLLAETTYNYVGDINDFNPENVIPTQFKNYKRIEELLNSQNIYFTEINIIKWNSKNNLWASPNRCKFIVKTTNPNLLWYKYDTEAVNGSHNLIYYKKKKINTSIFVRYTDEELNELLND